MRARAVALPIAAAIAIMAGAAACSRPGGVPARAAAPAHPAETMSLEQAYAEAGRHLESRFHLESLPYFRRMAALLPDADWSLAHDHANALQGASLQARTLRGAPAPATRSSYERIAHACAAQSELDRAANRSRTRAERSAVHLTRGRQLGTWGLSRDALQEIDRATEQDSSWSLATPTAREWALRFGRLDQPERGRGR